MKTQLWGVALLLFGIACVLLDMAAAPSGPHSAGVASMVGMVFAVLGLGVTTLGTFFPEGRKKD